MKSSSFPILSAGLTSLSTLLLVAWAVVSGCSNAAPGLGDACETTSQCEGAHLICHDGQCRRRTCERVDHCPQGFVCVDRHCAPPECETSDDCSDPDEICFERTCLPGCEETAECEQGLVCLGAPPTCREPPALCETDAECAHGYACLSARGMCLRACQTDVACSGERVCNRGYCRPSCSGSDECFFGEVCVDNQCVPPPECEDAPDCTGRTPFRDPATCRCVACLADDDCDRARRESCMPSGRCLYCPVESSSAEQCQAQGLMLEDGCCVQCRADEDCERAGLSCERGRCVEATASECVAAADCASGEVCVRGVCRPEPSLEACSRQSDCPDGEACYDEGRCRHEAAVCGGCPEPSRCVAEPGDTRGTCAGCTGYCAEEGCPDDAICVVEDGQSEGVCVDASAGSQLCP